MGAVLAVAVPAFICKTAVGDNTPIPVLPPLFVFSTTLEPSICICELYPPEYIRRGPVPINLIAPDPKSTPSVLFPKRAVPVTSRLNAGVGVPIPTLPAVSILILSDPPDVCKNLIGQVEADMAIPVALPDDLIIPSPAIPYCVPRLIVVLLTPNVKNRVPPLSFATKELIPLAFVFCACTSRSPDELPTTSNGVLGATPIPTLPFTSTLTLSDAFVNRRIAFIES
jgi:hypothetical protein